MSTSGPDATTQPRALPEVEVRRSARRRKTVTAFRESGRIVVVVPARLSSAEERRWVEEMVRRVERRESRQAPPTTDAQLQVRADDLARAHLDPVLGSAPRPRSVVWVDNQQRRWGSCTPASGTIRLSRRLQQLPDWVVDYVLVHELAHLVHGQHDDAFWRLVQHYPRTAEARGYLQGWADAQARGSAGPVDAD
ncbi:M48 family metallopeptidase [Auraticoccus cholistanensis]|uniref:M48 family metallopeptidase n=1 Tax=Auraticoccus cholistanensis TaxID=2656650 RepID=UPI002F9094AB